MSAVSKETPTMTTLNKVASDVLELRYITRDIVRRHPDTLFVFGDNMQRAGYGGQAKQMRGEPNAVGIPTKWRPSNTDDAFFVDTDMFAVQEAIDNAFARLINHKGPIVWPANGIGTGLANLKNRAPSIWQYIESCRKALYAGRSS